MTNLARSILPAAIALALGASNAHAVIILQSENRNLNAPPSAMLPAWNLQGQFSIFNGTPIGPEHFITAKHIGGAVGQTFTYAGQNYTTNGVTDIAGTDLRVWRVDTAGGTRRFPSWAPIWNPSVDGSELGKPLVVFGRGTARGEAIYAPINPGTTVTAPPRGSMVLTGEEDPTAARSFGPAPNGQGDLRGWRWGATDALQSWGQNTVELTVADPDYGQLIGFNFDAGAAAGPNEAILSSGDSSGGVFIRSASGQWKLAGVNLGVDGPFSFTAAGPYFNAALFDARGFYVGSPTENQLLPYGPDPLIASSYSTRVSSYFSQLAGITNNFGAVIGGGGTLLPEPSAGIVLLVATTPGRRRRRAG